jgi:hypothetical protein
MQGNQLNRRDAEDAEENAIKVTIQYTCISLPLYAPLRSLRLCGSYPVSTMGDEDDAAGGFAGGLEGWADAREAGEGVQHGQAR